MLLLPILNRVSILQAAQLQFRGQRIWLAAMEALRAEGMRFAKQV